MLYKQNTNFNQWSNPLFIKAWLWSLLRKQSCKENRGLPIVHRHDQGILSRKFTLWPDKVHNPRGTIHIKVLHMETLRYAHPEELYAIACHWHQKTKTTCNRHRFVCIFLFVWLVLFCFFLATIESKILFFIIF